MAALVRRVLVVDDDPIVCGALAGILQRVGFAVESEQVVPGILPHIVSFVPESILLDVDLGHELDGFELCRRIRTARCFDSIRLLMTTSLASSQSVRTAVNIGANDYIVKPPSAAVLIQKLMSQAPPRNIQDIRVLLADPPSELAEEIAMLHPYGFKTETADDPRSFFRLLREFNPVIVLFCRKKMGGMLVSEIRKRAVDDKQHTHVRFACLDEKNMMEEGIHKLSVKNPCVSFVSYAIQELFGVSFDFSGESVAESQDVTEKITRRGSGLVQSVADEMMSDAEPVA